MTTTLRSGLTQRKLEVSCSPRLNCKNTTSPTWPRISSDNIRLWNDFNLNTLNDSYGHVLDHAIPIGGVRVPRAEDFFKDKPVINTPNDTWQLLEWNDEILQPTLAFAKEHLDLYRGVGLRYSRSKIGHAPMATITKNPVRINHHIELDDHPRANLVVGLSRPSSKFQSRRVVEAPESMGIEGLWPLRQLANMCNLAKTRYGYIMTDQDLVACCFYAPEATQVAEHPGAPPDAPDFEVRMMPVPWTRHGAGQLTTDLALWWLCMLSLSPRQSRAPAPERDVVGINQWETPCIDNIGWHRRHRYSGARQHIDQPPPAHQALSLGNQATSAAGVGSGFGHDVGGGFDPTIGLDFDLNSDYWTRLNFDGTNN